MTFSSVTGEDTESSSKVAISEYEASVHEGIWISGSFSPEKSTKLVESSLVKSRSIEIVFKSISSWILPPLHFVEDVDAVFGVTLSFNGHVVGD